MGPPDTPTAVGHVRVKWHRRIPDDGSSVRPPCAAPAGGGMSTSRWRWGCRSCRGVIDRQSVSTSVSAPSSPCPLASWSGARAPIDPPKAASASPSAEWRAGSEARIVAGRPRPCWPGATSMPAPCAATSCTSSRGAWSMSSAWSLWRGSTSKAWPVGCWPGTYRTRAGASSSRCSATRQNAPVAEWWKSIPEAPRRSVRPAGGWSPRVSGAAFTAVPSAGLCSTGT
jgi:hypothetical protein